MAAPTSKFTRANLTTDSILVTYPEEGRATSTPIPGNHRLKPGVAIVVLKIGHQRRRRGKKSSKISVWWAASAGALKSCRR
jgi:hypothetical protein